MRCLVIEDETDTLQYIGNGLREIGYNVTLCNNGVDGMRLVSEEWWDLVVLDRMLPGHIDSFSIAARLCAAGRSTPVLILSALSKAGGPARSGDDYLSNQFALSELLARAQALLFRPDAGRDASRLQVADLIVDVRTMHVSRDARAIALQPHEFRLLEYLVRHQGLAVTRTMLLEAVWGYRFDPQSNVIDVQVSRLRNKIERDFTCALIHTVRGVGYIMSSDIDAWHCCINRILPSTLVSVA